MQLLRCAFKQATAARCTQGIAAKQNVTAQVCNVPARVTRHLDHAEWLINNARQCDVIVLAQASMQRLRDRIAEETGLPVLSSPRMGVALLAETVHRQVGVSGTDGTSTT